MPIAIDKNETFPVVLRTDQRKSPAPTFAFRHLSMRERRAAEQHNRAMTAFIESKSRDEEEANSLFDAILEDVRLGLGNWSNLDRRFDRDKLEDVCTVAEIWELFFAMLSGSSLGVADEKKSASRSRINTAKSAGARARGK